MPRRDVPYPGMICSLKERIAEIADALKTKLHSINGVEGDADGDVLLVSDHPAVLITEDQNQHQVKIGLDNSELPAAAVSSVNGETGAVVLDASEIGSIGGNVQSDINSLIADCFNNNAMISAEIAARGNADSALQTNINTVQAGIPGAAAAAVAADPTIQNLVAADAQNVKLTGSQSISGVKTVPTETTGNYSSQIANSSKVKNELDNYATMVRTANNQTIGGVKTFTSPIVFTPGDWHSVRATDSPVGEITLFAKLPLIGVGRYMDLEFTQSSNTAILYGRLSLSLATTPSGLWIIQKALSINNPLTADCIVIAKDSNDEFYLGCRRKVSYGNMISRVIQCVFYGAVQGTPAPYITWLTTPIPIGTGTGYTITEMTV